MLVTINCDASHSSHTGDGGYAFWISSNAGIFKRYGKFKNKVRCPAEAELMCIANAVYYTIHNKELWGISKIIINTDSKLSIHMIKTYSAKKKKSERLRIIARDIVNNLNGIKYDLRHIKAHTKDLKEKNAWVNDWCDRMSRKARKDKEDGQ